MENLSKLIVFVIVLAFAIAFFRDAALSAFGKEEYRSSNLNAGREIAIQHMDWASLRVGAPPRLMETIVHEDGSAVHIDETIKKVLKANHNLPIKNMKVQLIFNPEPAMIGLITETNFESQLKSLLKMDEKKIDIPNRSIHLIESYYEAYNY